MKEFETSKRETNYEHFIKLEEGNFYKPTIFFGMRKTPQPNICIFDKIFPQEMFMVLERREWHGVSRYDQSQVKIITFGTGKIGWILCVSMQYFIEVSKITLTPLTHTDFTLAPIK